MERTDQIREHLEARAGDQEYQRAYELAVMLSDELRVLASRDGIDPMGDLSRTLDRAWDSALDAMVAVGQVKRGVAS